MLTSLHHFKITWKNDSVLLVLGLSMKFLSQCLLLQHFSELRDISWQEISSLNRIFNFGSMQKYADKDPRWSLHAEEGPAQILVYFSCCHHKLLKNRFLVGRKGNGKEEESTLSFWKSYFSFHWSFSSGCLMVCVNWCASVSSLLSFPSVLAFHCAWHWCGITTGSVR